MIFPPILSRIKQLAFSPGDFVQGSLVIGLEKIARSAG
jgi:hypothetical protein